MATILPPIPRLVFTILEPISLLAGALAPVLDPTTFVTSQIPANNPSLPSSSSTSSALSKLSSLLPKSSTVQQRMSADLLPTEHVLALQLGNAYLLLMFIGLAVLNTTTEARVVRAYIWALWLADIGHVGVTAWMMGFAGTVNVAAWTPVMWGNIAATIFLFATRSAYLAGYLGQDTVTRDGESKEKLK